MSITINVKLRHCFIASRSLAVVTELYTAKFTLKLEGARAALE